MRQQIISSQQYQQLFNQQRLVLREIREIKDKLNRADAVREFEAIAGDMQKFARAKGIKPADVLEDD